MGKKAVYTACAAALAAFIVFRYARPFEAADLVYAGLMALMLGAACLIRFFINSLKGREKKPGPAENPAHISWKAIILLAGVVSLKYGFDLYHRNLMFKALVFFLAGLAMVFFSFYIADTAAQPRPGGRPLFKKEGARDTLVKLSICLGLTALGIFFLSAHHMDYLAAAAFAASLAQLVLLFRFDGFEPAPLETLKLKPAPVEAPGLYSGAVSFILICAAFYLYYLSFTFIRAYSFFPAMACFVIGSFLFGAAPAGAKDEDEGAGAINYTKYDFYFCAFLFILGLVMFSWDMHNLPPGLHGDENLAMRCAMSIHDGVIPQIYIESGLIQMPPLHYWIIAVVGKFFGVTIGTARWLSIIMSSFMLVFVYLGASEMFNRRVGVLSSLLLSTFFLVLLYSRNAISWIYVPSLAAGSYYLFFRGIKRGHMAYFAAAGALLGLNLYFYNAAKVSPFVYAIFMPFLFIRPQTRKQAIDNWRGMLVLVLGAVIAFSPVLLYAIMHPAIYLGRVSSQSIITHFPLQPNDYFSMVNNIILKVQMFFTLSANGYCHNIPQKPFFDGFGSFMLILGLGCLAFTWKSKSSFFIIIWMVIGMMASFMSYLGIEEPYPSRTILAIPAIIIAVAVGMERALAKIERLWPKILKYITLLAAVYFLTWYTFHNLNDFFTVFKNDPHTQVMFKSAEGVEADHIINNRNELFHISTRLSSSFHLGFRARLDSGRMFHEDISIFELNKLYNDKKMDVGVIGEGIYYKTFPIYKEYFPDAVLTTVWDRNFWMLDKTSNLKYCYEWKYPDKTIDMNKFMAWWYLYDPKVRFVSLAMVDIPWKDINSAFSLQAGFFKDGKKIGEAPVEESSIKAGFPFDRATAEGLIDAPYYHRYEFRIEGADGRVFINNSPAAGAVELHQGLNRIKVVINKMNGPEAVLLWKPEGTAQFSKINRYFTINSGKLFGLVATYSRDGKVIYKMAEPAIDYRLYYDMPRPPARIGNLSYYDISWDGYVNFDTAGEYQFKLDTLYTAAITVDGALVYKKDEKNREYIQPIKPGKGKKRIKVTGHYQYISTIWGEGATLRLLYKKGPQKEFGPVNYDMLSPGY